MHKRHGFTLIEMMAATALLAVVIVTFAPLMVWINDERKAAYQRQVALEEACNVLERVSAAPWEDVDEQFLETIEISSTGAQSLRNHLLVLSIEESPQPPRAKRVRVSLDWTSRSNGERAAPVRLTTWLHAFEGAAE